MTVPSHRPLRPGEVGPRLLVVMDGRPIGSLDSPSSREIKLTYTQDAPSVTCGIGLNLQTTAALTRMEFSPGCAALLIGLPQWRKSRSTLAVVIGNRRYPPRWLADCSATLRIATTGFRRSSPLVRQVMTSTT